MQRTLLLCFIHGFKGGDDTFGGFPEHLCAIVSNALPQIKVKTLVYPKFETRGDLAACVGRFRDWLQEKVIDIEVAAGTPSPMIDPSVHVILVGHSMGGIVAADTLLSIASDEPIKSPSQSTASVPAPPSNNATSNAINATTSTSAPSSRPDSPSGNGNQVPPSPVLMFPFITGVLAFDTPYLGISPGVLAYGAEKHYNSASSAYSALSSAASAFGWGSTSGKAAEAAGAAQKALPAAPSAQEALNASADAAAAPSWQSWGRYAMFAGAAGAVLAAGSAAYVNRDNMREGWGWVGSHLEFVGCLVRAEELKTRVGRVAALAQSRRLGFANLYTLLGRNAGRTEAISVAGGWIEVGGSNGSGGKGSGSGNGNGNGSGGGGGGGANRTFCALPRRDVWQPYFEACVNDKVGDEIEAHVNMFYPKSNPGYYEMSDKAKARVVAWVDKAWYQGSGASGASSPAPAAHHPAENDQEPVALD